MEICRLNNKTLFKTIIILSGIVFIFGCSNANKKSYPALASLNDTTSRERCSWQEAIRYSSVNELVEDFYVNPDIVKDSLELNILIGSHYLYKKMPDSSLFYYLKAEKIDSNNTVLLTNIAKALSDLNRFEEALTYLDNSAKICGENFDILNSKSYILGKLDRCEESIAAGRKSLELNPKNEKMYGNLSTCFDKLGQKDSVRKYIDIAINKFNFKEKDIEKIKEYYHYN